MSSNSDSQTLREHSLLGPVNPAPEGASFQSRKPGFFGRLFQNEVPNVLAVAAIASAIVVGTLGWNGIFGQEVRTVGALTWFLAWCAFGHLTITAMSLSFHRMHTHKGVSLHPFVDGAFQLWLWLTTSMCKVEWVSVHLYHHAHSDAEKDPHSPNQKGFWRVFLLGGLDYTRAKNSPEVRKLHRQIKENAYEHWLRKNLLWGPTITFIILAALFGPAVGALSAISLYLISPLLAVGGVNTLAHTYGYRTYSTKDNSRNIGFLFPLNFIICGELDHNNHHAHPKSCSFRHRWYEFDIGYAYLKIMQATGLAKLHHEAPERAKERQTLKVLA